MREDNRNYIIHFQNNKISVFKINNKVPLLKKEYHVFFNEALLHVEMLNKIREFFEKFQQEFGFLDNEHVRIFGTGIFQDLSKEEQTQILLDAFVRFGVVFNIPSPDLVCFYQSIGNGSIVDGICKQEFRKVVICGSFQQDLKQIETLMDLFRKRNIEVLSPWTTQLVPKSIGTNFVLLEGQELYNERDSWRHKFDHMLKFIKADAIIVCNPEGRIGKGTLFEFGFMIAHAKRIIFTNRPEGLTIHFPYEVGIK